MFKHARRIIIGATLALVLMVTTIGINAEEPESVKKQETDVNMRLKDGVIDEPDDSGYGNEGNPESVKGHLAIWKRPTKMKFSGTYSEITDYHLDIIQDNGKPQASKWRSISIADVRSGSVGWNLKAKMTKLREVDSEGNILQNGKTIERGYKYTADHSVKKYQINDDGSVKQGYFILVDNGVVSTENLDKTIIEPETKTIFHTQVSEKYPRPGKGYTKMEFYESKLVFDAATGFAGDFSGKIMWTLTDTPE